MHAAVVPENQLLALFQTVDRTTVRRLERKRQTELTVTLISVTYAV